jgi:tRNA1Val (adenine37-N6)-methyltransferase
MVIVQDPSLFCFGMDAVLLSSYARIRKGSRVLDLCSGNGIIPLLLCGKSEAGHITGLELFEENVSLARRSTALNRLEERVSFLCGDVKDHRSLLKEASFDAVTCNPPYMIGSHGRTGENELLTAARHETRCTLEDVVDAAAWALKSSGSLFLIHRPFRLPEIIRTLSAHHLEPKGMRLIYPFADREPNMVLIKAVKGGRPRMQVGPPLIVYEKPGVYTREVLSMYGG